MDKPCISKASLNDAYPAKKSLNSEKDSGRILSGVLVGNADEWWLMEKVLTVWKKIKFVKVISNVVNSF